MNRRDFLKTSLALPILLNLPETKVYNSFWGSLGEYVSHKCFVREYDSYELIYPPVSQNNINFRPVRFPKEVILIIDYQNGYEDYFSFNLTEREIEIINRLTPAELFAKVFNSDSLHGPFTIHLLEKKFDLNLVCWGGTFKG